MSDFKPGQKVVCINAANSRKGDIDLFRASMNGRR